MLIKGINLEVDPFQIKDYLRSHSILQINNLLILISNLLHPKYPRYYQVQTIVKIKIN